MKVRLVNSNAEDEIKEGEASDRPHPLTPISKLLWEVDRELTKVQEEYVFSEELFEWTLIFAQETRKFRRIVQTAEAIIGKR